MYRVFNHWVSGRTLLFVDRCERRRRREHLPSLRSVERALHPDGAVSRGHAGAVTGGLLLLLSGGFVTLYQAALYFVDLYDLRVSTEDRARCARLIRALGFAVFGMAMALTLLGIRPPEGVVLGGAFGAILGVITARGLLGSALARPSRVLVVGRGPRAQRLLEPLDGAEEAAQVAALVDARRLAPGKETLLEVARRARAEAVILATEPGHEHATPEDLARCRYSGIRVFGAAQYCERLLRRIPVHVLDGVQFATADELGEGPLRRASKRAFDIAVAGALLVLAAPLMALLVVLIRLDSRGPAFYRQERVGRNGRTYPCGSSGACGSTRRRTVRLGAGRDERVTRVGRFIRKSGWTRFPGPERAPGRHELRRPAAGAASVHPDHLP
jgi:hypothetical protein